MRTARTARTFWRAHRRRKKCVGQSPSTIERTHSQIAKRPFPQKIYIESTKNLAPLLAIFMHVEINQLWMLTILFFRSKNTRLCLEELKVFHDGMIRTYDFRYIYRELKTY